MEKISSTIAQRVLLKCAAQEDPREVTGTDAALLGGAIGTVPGVLGGVSEGQRRYLKNLRGKPVAFRGWKKAIRKGALAGGLGLGALGAGAGYGLYRLLNRDDEGSES